LQAKRELLSTRLNKMSMNPKSLEERAALAELEGQHKSLTKLINDKKVEIKQL